MKIRDRVLRLERVRASDLLPNPKNWRTHPDEQKDALRGVLAEIGYADVLLARETPNGLMLIDGHARAEITPDTEVPVAVVDLDEAEADLLLASLDPLAAMAGRNDEALAALLADVHTSNEAVRKMLDDLLGAGAAASSPGTGVGKPTPPSLVERFGVPPFSVLDARQGYWQERKRGWLSLGLRSEVGRGENLMGRGILEMVTLWTGFTYQETKDFVDARRAAGVSDDDIRGEAQRMGRRGAIGSDAKARGKTFAKNHSSDDEKLDPVTRKIIDATVGKGTSIFDPVLCELAYRWFCPPDGTVLDPFAGGSVRGVVAARLGRGYVGIDLREEQVEANRQQWDEIGSAVAAAVPAVVPDETPDLTPVDWLGDEGVWVKRDDAFAFAGVRGGKVRTCRVLSEGASGLVTAGSRQSPQANIVAQIARRLGVPCRVHTPQGELSPELLAAKAAGAEVVQHPAGYNNVIVARAREDAAARGWTEIPFGMECEEAVRQTSRQVANLPPGAHRLVAPVGSGMSLAGILHGLVAAGRDDLKVLGVVVGADPEKRLDRYAPKGWRDRVTLVPSGLDYHAHAPKTRLAEIELDPVYEAKCLPFLLPGDVLWVVGRRQTAEPATLRAAPVLQWVTGDSRELPTLLGPDFAADFVFSCPPYADLEVYSDDPRDLSTMSYEAFLAAYREIIAAAVARLRPDRFACFVVGDVRDGKGLYRNFPAETIAAFEAAGARLYNEAVLVTAVSTLALRAAGAFVASRKLGKAHQNVLVFVKGDARKATEAIGPVEFGEVDPASIGAEETAVVNDGTGTEAPEN